MDLLKVSVVIHILALFQPAMMYSSAAMATLICSIIGVELIGPIVCGSSLRATTRSSTCFLRGYSDMLDCLG
jgi:hypothetical protein